MHASFHRLSFDLLQGFKQYPQAWRLRPLWMARRSRSLLTLTYPRGSHTITSHQSFQGSSQGRFLQPSWGSRAPQRLIPLSAYGGSHDYAWTSNLNAVQANVKDPTSAYSGHYSLPTPSAMKSGETNAKLCIPHQPSSLHSLQQGTLVTVLANSAQHRLVLKWPCQAWHVLHTGCNSACSVLLFTPIRHQLTAQPMLPVSLILPQHSLRTGTVICCTKQDHVYLVTSHMSLSIAFAGITTPLTQIASAVSAVQG